MESEENLSLKKQISEKNISVEKSSSVEIAPKVPEEKRTKSPINFGCLLNSTSDSIWFDKSVE